MSREAGSQAWALFTPCKARALCSDLRHQTSDHSSRDSLFSTQELQIFQGLAIGHKAILGHTKKMLSADSTVLGWARPGLQRQEELGDSSKELLYHRIRWGLVLP